MYPSLSYAVSDALMLVAGCCQGLFRGFLATAFHLVLDCLLFFSGETNAKKEGRRMTGREGKERKEKKEEKKMNMLGDGKGRKEKER